MWFERSLRAARARASSLVEWPWRAGFLATGAFTRSSAAPWSATGTDRVVVISPHPDDEAIACSGTMLRHLAAGEDVVVAIVTDGRLSKQAATPDEMAEIRRAEALLAARRLGVERLEWLGLREGDWQAAKLQRLLRALLQRYEPTIVYAPSRVDFHPEHLAVAHALAGALASLGEDAGAIRVRAYQVQVPLTRILTNVVSDVSVVLPESTAALAAYDSQLGAIESVHRRRRYGALAHRALTPAASRAVEEFWQLTASQYVEVHRGGTAEWLGKFRGIRRFAWTDPLAYWRGNAERRRLHDLAAAGSAEQRSVA